MAKKVKQQEETLEVEEALSKSGKWIIDHQNLLSWIIVGIVAVILAILAINNYVIKPRTAEAQDEIARAVVYFAAQDYEKALNGDEADCLGFDAIASKYGALKPGKLAALYAGICQYNLGDYEEAIRLMKKFNGNDINVAPAAKMHIGDAYVALEDYKSAASYFEKAAKADNEVITPMALKKAALAYLELDNQKRAKQLFETIKEKYPQSIEAQDIDKYIANIAL